MPKETRRPSRRVVGRRSEGARGQTRVATGRGRPRRQPSVRVRDGYPRDDFGDGRPGPSPRGRGVARRWRRVLGWASRRRVRVLGGGPSRRTRIRGWICRARPVGDRDRTGGRAREAWVRRRCRACAGGARWVARRRRPRGARGGRRRRRRRARAWRGDGCRGGGRWSPRAPPRWAACPRRGSRPGGGAPRTRGPGGGARRRPSRARRVRTCSRGDARRPRLGGQLPTAREADPGGYPRGPPHRDEAAAAPPRASRPSTRDARATPSLSSRPPAPRVSAGARAAPAFLKSSLLVAKHSRKKPPRA